MALRRALVLIASSLVLVAALPSLANAQTASVSIDRFATLSADGSISFTVHVACELPGSPDFRQGLAGATQPRTGAAAEGGLSPDIVCDGVERAYTAGVSRITEAAFRKGTAIARATVLACNTVGDQQVCVQESAQRRVVVR